MSELMGVVERGGSARPAGAQRVAVARDAAGRAGLRPVGGRAVAAGLGDVSGRGCPPRGTGASAAACPTEAGGGGDTETAGHFLPC